MWTYPCGKAKNLTWWNVLFLIAAPCKRYLNSLLFNEKFFQT